MVLSLSHTLIVLPTLIVGIALTVAMRRFARRNMVEQPVPITVPFNEEK